MLHSSQSAVESFERVQIFLDGHADIVGTLKDSEARKQLDDAVAQLTAQALNQGTANLLIAGQMSRRRQLVTELRAKHMYPIAKFARARLRGVPDFTALAQSGHNLEGNTLVRAARAMATAALPQLDKLTQARFPADVITQLGSAADAVSAAITERATTLVQRVGSTAGIRQQVARGKEAVGMLDPVVSRMIAANAELVAAWRSARRITAKPGGTGSAVAPATGSTVAPGSQASVVGVVGPAAAPSPSTPSEAGVKAA